MASLSSRPNQKNFFPIAILYQAAPPPPLDGIPKPMKVGGYRDSGADIAYVLRARGLNVTTPVAAPAPDSELDWVFPDDNAGIQSALTAGARVFWANTVLYDGHALQSPRLRGLGCVGQEPRLVQKFDDKWVANRLLHDHGCPTPTAALVDDANLTAEYVQSQGLEFPLVIKPIRGRGSQGVCRIASLDELRKKAGELLGTFGDRLLIEQYLAGREVTVTVMPPGVYVVNGREESRERPWALPGVERFSHANGIAPYSGKVAVTVNSRLLADSEQHSGAYSKLKEHCERAYELVGSRAPIRIDCRASQDGIFRLFDLNLKPNMTGPGRPGRENQASLSALAARGIGWEYSDFIVNVARQAWEL